MLDDVTRARLAAQHVEQAEGGFCETCGSLWEWPCAVRALLTAYDALRLRAENAEQDRDTLRRDLARAGQAVSAAEQARDQALADAAIQQQRAGATQVLLDRAEARLATRGALEAAARACYRGEGPQAYTALLAAVTALDPAPGEAGR